MGKRLYEVTEDIQDRIRETAYLMWESAGRQHGLAMEYWLKAESDMLSTMQAATAKMISSMSPGRSGTSAAEPPGTAPATVATTATAQPAAANRPPPVEPVREQADEPARTLAVEVAG